jgi:hypothetical protein
MSALRALFSIRSQAGAWERDERFLNYNFVPSKRSQAKAWEREEAKAREREEAKAWEREEHLSNAKLFVASISQID